MLALAQCPNVERSVHINQPHRSEDLRLDVTKRQRDLLPAIDLFLQIRDELLQVISSLHTPLSGFSCCHGVPGTLDGDNVGRVIDSDCWKRLVSSFGSYPVRRSVGGVVRALG